PVEIVHADRAGMLLAPGQEIGCVLQSPGSPTLSVLVLEHTDEGFRGELGRVSLWTFDPHTGFKTDPETTWQLPGIPVQALPLDDARVCLLCRGAVGVFLVMLDTRTREVVADATLPMPHGPAQGPASPMTMAMTPDKRRLLALASGFSLQSPRGDQRSWLHQLDVETFALAGDSQEFPGIPQTPAPSLWPLENGACWVATASPGEGFAHLFRVPLTPSAPRAVEQPFTNVSVPLQVAPAPTGNSVAAGIRDRLELWPEGEPIGTPERFEHPISLVSWTEEGLFVGEGHRLHVVNPANGAVLQTATFQSGVVAQAIPLPPAPAGAITTKPDSALSAHLADVVVFRGEAVGREQRVLDIQTKDGPEVQWRIDFDAAAMPWLRVHPRSGGPDQAGFAVMGVDAAILSSHPADTLLRGSLHLELRDPGAAAGHGVTKHSITVLVSPRPEGPRSILWFLGSGEAQASLLEPDGDNALHAAAVFLAGPPQWFSHQCAASPFNEPLTEHAIVVLTARAASEGVVTRQALLSYVAAGGSVLFLGTHFEESEGRTLADWLAPIGVRLDTSQNMRGTFDVSGAPLLCRNWRSVRIENGCRIEVEPPGTTLVRDPQSGGAIFAIVPHGLGRMAFLASSTPLEASALSDPAHRRFVSDLFRWLDDAGREVSDLDGDGLTDTIEDPNQNAALDPGETDRFNPDTDGDGIPDSIEDHNRNGRTDEGETSAVNPDSDGDGVWDGADLSPLPRAGTPVVDAVRPAEYPAEGGIWVQVKGRNFAPGMRVRFGERVAEQVRVLGPRGLEARLPPAESPEGATVDVVVEGLEQGQTGLLPDGFRYGPRSSVTLTLEHVGRPRGDIIHIAIDAVAERSAHVERLTFRLDTEPPRAVEWLKVVAGNDALRSGRQVVSRPDPEGGIWMDISPARTGYPLGSLVVVQCRALAESPLEDLRFAITRARAFAPNGASLEVEIRE
ncbi:MAG: hypothetical protein U9Q79_00165, partial [Candidatus Hydrogenedentes bacterium]|nr:hypothetical protein [Candidatus Hydrogenedentota bacterium]